jgi:threonine synthase
MKYYSTHHQAPKVSFREAVVKGIAEDGGLYFPEEVKKLPQTFFNRLKGMSLPEIGYEFLKLYAGGELPDAELKQLMEDVFTFDTPLVKVSDDVYSLELFHGPTLAFKDVGARTLARFMSKFAGDKKITVLVATSGDTGSAVANGFFNMPNIEVVVLYPKGRVSRLQEKQMTTLGGNITALEVKGNFDDCQRMVKEAFADEDLNNKLQLSSANSINIARLLPQAVYYFSIFSQLGKTDKPVVVSVPSGNLGNLTAGLLAAKAGVPVAKFIASANINKVFPDYVHTGLFTPRTSVATLSNAMDVGNPSNFSRIMELYHHSVEDVKNDIVAYSFDDEQTKANIAETYDKTGYILDPHGSVAHLGLKAYMEQGDFTGVFLETAHPAKFHNTVEEAINKKIEFPERLQKSMNKKGNSVEVENTLESLKEFLLTR